MYKVILLDFDDTLYHFHDQSEGSLKRALSLHGIEMTEEIYNCYEVYNQQFWRGFEQGKYKSSSEAYIRFEQLREHYGFDYDSKQFNREYLTNLYRYLVPVEGAEQFVKKASEKYEIYIITNGLHDAQVPKLEASGLKPYVKGMFISEDIGYSKPHEKFFQHCLSEIGVSKADVIVIGDSLASDIAGGIGAELDTCWFNPGGKETDLKPTYTVSSLLEVEKILNL